MLDRGGELKDALKMLRVREQRAPDGAVLGSRLTAKAPVAAHEQVLAESAGLKERVERETEVEGAGTVLALLGILGYEPVRRYDKVRRSFCFLDHEVVLDHTPMGDFVEVEGVDPRAVATALQLDLKRAQLTSYLELYDEYREQNPEAPSDMVFPQEATPKGFRPVDPDNG